MVKLDAQDMSNIATTLARMNQMGQASGTLDLGDVVVYDDGEPLGTITFEDGEYKFSQQVEDA